MPKHSAGNWVYMLQLEYRQSTVSVRNKKLPGSSRRTLKTKTVQRRLPMPTELLQSASSPPRGDSSGGDIATIAYVSDVRVTTSSASYVVRGSSREIDSIPPNRVDDEIPPPDYDITDQENEIAPDYDCAS